MTTRAEILRMLSDGAFHSGTDLGKKLGITRAAVCKNIRGLTQSGLDVHRVTGRGYKLDAPLTLLNRSRILKHLGLSVSGSDHKETSITHALRHSGIPVHIGQKSVSFGDADLII